MNADFESLVATIRARRTSMAVDADREVRVELVERLCELAQWAPNHGRSWPLRFALFRGPGRSRLGEAFVTDMIAIDFGDDVKRAKTRTKYLRTPAVLVVGAASHPKPTLHDEQRDTAAAGIQNLLLGATRLGLASYWSTPPVIDGPSALALCGFEPDVRIVGVIYLGWATDDAVETPQRPPAPLTVVDG